MGLHLSQIFLQGHYLYCPLSSVLLYFFPVPLISAAVEMTTSGTRNMLHPPSASTHTHTDTQTSHLDLCLILRQSPDRKHLSRWNPARQRKRREREKRRERGGKWEEEEQIETAKNINLSVVAMTCHSHHIKSNINKPNWFGKGKSSEINTNFIPTKCYRVRLFGAQCSSFFSSEALGATPDQRRNYRAVKLPDVGLFFPSH